MHLTRRPATGANGCIWRDVIASMEQVSKQRNCKHEDVRPIVRTPPKRYYLSGQYDGLYLTERQRDVLLLFLQNKSAAEIARTLGLSERTIEDYSRALRTKFGCATKKRLIAQIKRDGLDQLLERLH